MKIIFIRQLSVAITLALISGCAAPRNSITQFGSIDALLAGAYDGQVSCGSLTRRGNLGLGTFDQLDGEMVVLDGRVYQVRSDGKVYSPAAGATTPFAAVVRFEPDQSRTVNNAATFQQFQEQLDATLPSTNVVCAFRVTGRFQQMKTRSVPAQTKPYAPLIEASRRQSVFELGQCRGTLVGFRLPGFVKGINVPGYHVHFLTADRNAGGHVLDFMLEGGVLELAICSRIELLLPTDATALKDIDFSRDRAHELEKVEK